MLSPAALGLPYPSLHASQWEAITRIVSSPKRFILLEAPTGIGKSGIVVGAANLLDLDLLVATGTKQLQDQYAVTLDLTDVRGRGNFPCLLEETTADQAPCTVGSPCDHKVFTRHSWLPPDPATHGACDPCASTSIPCPYYDQRYAGEFAPRAVLNYTYLLMMMNYAGSFTNKGLTVLDEAHTLEDELRRFTTIRFTRRQADLLKLKIPWAGDDVAAWQAWCVESRLKLSPIYHALARGDMGQAFGDQEHQYRQAVMSYWRNSGMLLSMYPEGWVAAPVTFNGVETGSTEFKPIWVGPLAQPLLYRHLGSKVILMSGTILDPEIFSHQIGLPPEDTEFIQLGSSFDKKRRPFKYQPIGKVRPRDEVSMKILAYEIDQIIEAHPGQSGIIHTVSHSLAASVLKFSKHTRLMIGHDKNNKAQQLELFKRTPGMVWVSPSSGMGVDLPYDLCRWQVIAKLPFPDMGDKQIKQLMKKDPEGRPTPRAAKWYNWITLCSVIQMYGRGMRAPDDECTTYLLDSNWHWFRKATRDLMPRWFSEAIINPKPVIIKEQTQEELLRELGVQG